MKHVDRETLDLWSDYFNSSESRLTLPVQLDHLSGSCAMDEIFQQNSGEPTVKPFVRVVDLSDPFGKRKADMSDDGSGGKRGLEAGLTFSF